MAITVNNEVDLGNIKAIVFNYDGTLFNNVPAIKAATQDVLDRINTENADKVSIDEFLELMTEINENNLPSILLNHYKTLNNLPIFKDLTYLQKLQVLFMIYSKYKQYSEVSQLYSGTKELLTHLSQKFDLAILTNSNREEITQALQKFGILNYFKSILTLDEVKNPKPNPEGIRKAMSQMHYLPENTLYVGDSATDILTARAANVPAIAISNGLISRQNLMECKPNLIFDHITELTQFFNLPEISIDKKIDLEKPIDYHAEKIKAYVKEEFNFFSLLQEVLPTEMKFDARQTEKMLQDPLGFIGAILQDGINRYTRGEIELKQQFTAFSNVEDDLMKCLGLIIIHFVNERSNNLIANLIKNPATRLSSRITAFGLKVAFNYFYPVEYKRNFQSLFLKLFGKIIPAESLKKLEGMETSIFTNSVLDGCEFALYDLGLLKLRNIDFKTIKPISNSVSSVVFSGPIILGQRIWKRLNAIAQDIIDNDFRRYPEDRS
jgi:HAD superfamily hydrolase (TIGR01509 family)